MQYIETSQKSVQEVVDLLKTTAPNFGFGVLHVHNIKKTLQSKGKDFQNECQVVDICNANIAEQVLKEDLSVSCIMPCKIAVYSQDDETHIILNSLVQLIDDINPELIVKDQEVQDELLKIIDEIK